MTTLARDHVTGATPQRTSAPTKLPVIIVGYKVVELLHVPNPLSFLALLVVECLAGLIFHFQVEVPPARWFRRPADPLLPEGLAEMTIPQAFLHQAARCAAAAVLADPAAGVKTYRDVAAAATVLRPALAALAGERVGVMMPASVAADVTVLAAQLAGKVPVLVNWTLGAGNVDRCLDAAGVRCVLTARAVRDRLAAQDVQLGSAGERLVFLEDLVAAAGRRAKLRAAGEARLSWRSLRRSCASVRPVAAVLFTSGSESAPKAVPLTHRNILTNVADVWGRLLLGRGDALLGMLPPFHAFGLTASVVLPLVAAVPVVHYPVPTDAAALAGVIQAYRPTLLAGTPTFLDGIVRAAAGDQLASLRLVVSGAEACPPRVREALADRCGEAVVLEGYGVTECGPIIAVGDRRDPRPGSIGRALPSLEHAVVDPQTHRPVPAGRQGLLLVRGPSVFAGYLNPDAPSPFVVHAGQRWYGTGDLVRRDVEGVLTFVGRLKRFVKLGGEMISLPAIEAALAERFAGADDEGPALAVVATGSDERPEIVLVTTRGVDRASANRAIRAAGLSGLHNVRRVVRVEALPLLGTGKTDHRALTERLRAQAE